MDKLTVSPINITGAAGFLEWLKRYQPWAFAAIKARIPKGLPGFGALSDGALGADAAATTGATVGWADTLKNLLTAAGTAYLTKTQVDAQKDLWNMQLERARNGLAPLDVNPEQMGLPGPSVSVGLSPGTRQMLLWGGLGLAALLLLPKLMHGRRS